MEHDLHEKSPRSLLLTVIEYTINPFVPTEFRRPPYRPENPVKHPRGGRSGRRSTRNSSWLKECRVFKDRCQKTNVGDQKTDLEGLGPPHSDFSIFLMVTFPYPRQAMRQFPPKENSAARGTLGFGLQSWPAWYSSITNMFHNYWDLRICFF